MTEPDIKALCERARALEKLVEYPSRRVTWGNRINPDGPALADAIEALVKERVIRPMGTAPKDRTPIMALTHDDIYPRIHPGRDDLKRWNGIWVIVHHPGLADDGFDLGWSVSAPVGVGIGKDDWFVGWLPTPPARQQGETE